MAEETKEETKEESKEGTSNFDEAKMAELIKANVSASQKELIAQLKADKEEEKPKEEVKEDFWDEIVNSRTSGKINQANVRAEAAEDKVDFYSSDEWLEGIDDLLPGDSLEEVKKHKKEIRTRLETTFQNMLKAGRGTHRADLLDYELGKYLKENKKAFIETVEKKSTKRKEVELQKARKGVDITAGNVSNFTPSDIHAMSMEKVIEEFGHVGF